MSKASIPATSSPVEHAFLVYVNDDAGEDPYVEAELEGLCEAAGVEVVGSERQRVGKPTHSTYLGSGKVEEIGLAAKEIGADLLVIDGKMSGIQHRNVQERTGIRVVDRPQLILDIFARRAKTKEGALQVELALLNYMLPKLMSVYTKFERQKGGIGMRGPGETKLESDRRLVRDRIAKLSEEIEDVRRVRDIQRVSRRKHPYPFASLVGYTSAGKSTLMNALAQTELLADAMPFATLDPTTRKIELPDGYGLFLTDTVGFIRHLPTELIAAFRATLEEVKEADFIIHVVDLSHPSWELQFDTVIDTLKVLGAEDKQMLTVFNKIDAVPDPLIVRRAVAGTPNSVAISALDGQGIPALLDAMVRQVRSLLQPIRALVPYQESALVQACYDFGRVLNVEYLENGIQIEAELVSEMRQRLLPFAELYPEEGP